MTSLIKMMGQNDEFDQDDGRGMTSLIKMMGREWTCD